MASEYLKVLSIYAGFIRTSLVEARYGQPSSGKQTAQERI